jgi:hypothetical protein
VKIGEVIAGAVIAAGITAAFMAIANNNGASSTETYRGFACSYWPPTPGATLSFWTATAVPTATATIHTSFNTTGADMPTTQTALHALIDAALAANG